MRGSVKRHFEVSFLLWLVVSNALVPCIANSSAPSLGGALTPKADNSVVHPTPIASAPTGAPKAFKLNVGITQEYVLGPGDVMSVTDLSSEEDKLTSSMSPVLPDGTAVIHYAGVIKAAGMSLREVNDLVNDRAKKWFVNPQIVVNLAHQRATQVYLLGDVNHPGLYSPDSASDNASAEASSGEKAAPPPPKSVFTISAALEIAGGLKDTADIRHIHVTRLHPKQVIDIDLWKLMLDGDISEDIVLQPGDVIYVPKGGTDFDPNEFGKVVGRVQKVRVMGAVRNPGLMTMSGSDDMLDVIAKAGGFTDTASAKYVFLTRTNRDGSIVQEKVDMKKAINNPQALGRVKVHPGDIVIVKNSMTKTVARTTGRILPQMLMSAAMSMFLLKAQTTTVAAPKP